jgi:UDPglucose 6-dehydrogenase
MQMCKDAGATCIGYDPVAADNVQKDHPGLCDISDDVYDTLNGVDALVISTDWDDFKHPDFDRMKAAMSAPVIFDGRNLYSLELMQREGFEYYSVGRKAVTSGTVNA